MLQEKRLSLRAFPYQSEGRVEQCDHDVRHCQVDNEEAGSRVHALVLKDDMTDQDIAEEREDDDEGVGHNEQGFHRGVLGLGPIASPAHEVLPVRESVVGPEVRGVGPGQGCLHAGMLSDDLRLLSGSHRGQKKEKQDRRDGHVQPLQLWTQGLDSLPGSVRGGWVRGSERTGIEESAPQRGAWARGARSTEGAPTSVRGNLDHARSGLERQPRSSRGSGPREKSRNAKGL